MTQGNSAPYLLGIDVLIDENKNPWILEANDSPATLLGSDSPSKVETLFLNNISRYLIDRDVSALVVQLSNKFEGLSSGEISLLIKNSKHPFLKDLNCILSYLENKGISCIPVRNLSELDAIQLDKNHPYSNRALFKRGPEDAEVGCGIELNSKSLRNICRDKLFLSNLLTGESVACVPAYEKPASNYLFSKPRFGYGSIDVELGEPVLNKDFIYQPQVVLDTVQKNSFEYFYDLRINIFNGRVLNEFVRLSAAPRNALISPREKAVWLTTSGDKFSRTDFSKSGYSASIPWKNARQLAIKAAKKIASYNSRNAKSFEDTTIDPYKACRDAKYELINS